MKLMTKNNYKKEKEQQILKLINGNTSFLFNFTGKVSKNTVKREMDILQWVLYIQYLQMMKVGYKLKVIALNLKI